MEHIELLYVRELVLLLLMGRGHSMSILPTASRSNAIPTRRIIVHGIPAVRPVVDSRVDYHHGVLIAFGRTVRASHWLVSLLSAAGFGGAIWWGMAVFSTDPAELHYVISIAVISTALRAAAFDDWTSVGHLAFAGTAVASGAFLAYAGYVLLFTSQLGAWSIAFGVILWLFTSVCACAGVDPHLRDTGRGLSETLASPGRWMSRAGAPQAKGFASRANAQRASGVGPPDSECPRAA